MSDHDDRFDAQDFARAGRIAASLAKNGYDLSASERSALRHASELMTAWGRMMPRTPQVPGVPKTGQES